MWGAYVLRVIFRLISLISCLYNSFMVLFFSYFLRNHFRCTCHIFLRRFIFIQFTTSRQINKAFNNFRAFYFRSIFMSGSKNVRTRYRNGNITNAHVGPRGNFFNFRVGMEMGCPIICFVSGGARRFCARRLGGKDGWIVNRQAKQCGAFRLSSRDLYFNNACGGQGLTFTARFARCRNVNAHLHLTIKGIWCLWFCLFLVRACWVGLALGRFFSVFSKLYLWQGAVPGDEPVAGTCPTGVDRANIRSQLADPPPSTCARGTSAATPLTWPPVVTPAPFIVVGGGPYTLTQVLKYTSVSMGDRPSALGGSGTVPWAVVREVDVRDPLPKSPETGDPGQGARTGVLVGVAHLVPGYFEGGKVTEVGDISLVYRVRDEVARYFAPGRSTCSNVRTGRPEGESPCIFIV